LYCRWQVHVHELGHELSFQSAAGKSVRNRAYCCVDSLKCGYRPIFDLVEFGHGRGHGSGVGGKIVPGLCCFSNACRRRVKRHARVHINDFFCQAIKFTSNLVDGIGGIVPLCSRVINHCGICCLECCKHWF